MTEIIPYNQLGKGVVAFTTLRTLGRDRTRLCQMLSIPDECLIVPHQTHEDEVFIIEESFLSLSDDEKAAWLEGIDAVITRIPQVCIGVSTADCVPILLRDTRHNVVGAVHSGWRGTVKRIVQKTLSVMQEEFATRPEDVLAVIGPAISQDRFEVGDEVFSAFSEAGFDMPAMSIRKEKWHLNLFQANRQLLLEAGIPEENIHIDGTCTYDNTHLLFSARREQVGQKKCGRNFNAVMVE